MLASVLIDPRAIEAVAEQVVPDDLFWPANQKAYAAMLALRERGMVADLPTVAAEMERRGDLEAAGGVGFLVELTRAEATSIHIAHYGGIVRDHALRRRLMEMTQRVREAVAVVDDPERLLCELERETGALRSTLPGDKAEGCAGLVSIGELLLEPEAEHRWAVEGMLKAEGTSLLVAQPKVGKTRTAQDLAVSVSQGKRFLGRDTVQGAVLYFALEESRDEVRRNMRALGAGAEDPLFLHIGPAPQEGLNRVKAEARRYRPVLIILDPFQRLMRVRDVNDYAVVSEAMEQIAIVARDAGCHVLVTHHGNKVGGSEGRGVLGSTALFGGVDTLIELTKDGDERLMNTIQRYGADLEQSLVEMDPETGHMSLGGTRRDRERSTIAAQMLEVLEARQESDGPMPQQALFAAVKGSTDAKVRAVGWLVSEGRVVRSGKGRSGSPYAYDLFLFPSYIDGKRKRHVEGNGHVESTIQELQDLEAALGAVDGNGFHPF